MPTILFGAFDRHNFGDLLFAHIAAALLRDEDVRFAGLVDRDLQIYGGHRVESLTRQTAKCANLPVRLIHVGGEILTCDAWQAAIMLQPLDTVQGTIARLDNDKAARHAWAARQLGLNDLAPYCISRALFPLVESIAYLGVGGVDLDTCELALRTEVLVKLAGADWIGVRDERTLAHLAAAGIAASLVPDPAVMVAEFFGQKILAHGLAGEVAQIAKRFAGGYLAIQFSADFGDDATLAIIVAQLDQIMAETGLGVVLFRAGSAPWHDDAEVYRRLVARMQADKVAVFASLDIWDICALIAGSRAYCGSSLHGRIVAMAHGLPRINLVHPTTAAGHPSKQAAFASTWEAEGVPATAEVPMIASGLKLALAVDASLLQQTARALVERFRMVADAVPGLQGRSG